MMPRPKALCLLVPLLAAPSLSFAQECRSYEDCLTQMETANGNKDFPSAQRAAEAAYDFNQDKNLLYNLGRFHRKQGHAAEALDYYQRYLDSHAESLTPARQAQVEEIVRTLQAELTPRPDPTPIPVVIKQHDTGAAPRLTGWSYAGIPVAAAGLGLLTFGGIALGADGMCVDDSRPCDMRYDSLTPGIGATVAGAALVGAGVTFLLIDARRFRRLSSNR